MKLKQLLLTGLASVLLIGAVPTQANQQPAQPSGWTFRAMITPLTLGMAALAYIGMHSEYWEKVNNNPTKTRWQKLRQAVQSDIAENYTAMANGVRSFRNGFRKFFGLMSFDQGEGYEPDNFDVRTYAQKEKEQQEREDRELAQRLQNQFGNEAPRANARQRAQARPRVQARSARRR